MGRSKTAAGPANSINPGSTALKKNNNALRLLFPFIVLLSLLLIWYFISYINLFPAYALPSPGAVLKSFREELRQDD